MICPEHQKEMRQNSKGYFCPTPIKKSPDGKTVLEWCKWKPEKSATPEREQLEGKVLMAINTKLDKLIEMVSRLHGATE